MRDVTVCIAAFCVPFAAGCGSTETRESAVWSGTMDTLPSGQVVVRNTAEPLWQPGDEWMVVEDLRIGRREGDGPDVFARIRSFEVDRAGRFWVLEDQAQELRVFGPSGEHMRTVGRQGGGPGEFARAVKVDLGPNGEMWVMDPQNARVSLFDMAGVFIDSRPAAGGFITLPWPGGFDDRGRYYAPGPRGGLVRYDSLYAAIDTLANPQDPLTREPFEVRDDAGRTRAIADVPYEGDLRWTLSSAGTIWAMVSDQYRLFELRSEDDTLRTITRRFEPLHVTAEDLERVAEDLAWFTDLGGQIDRSKIPSTKPPVIGFFQDDERNLWVERTTARPNAGRLFDVFDAEGRYLGEVDLPFPLSLEPEPILRNGVLYGVTRDDLEVPYILRARIIKPSHGPPPRF